MHFGRWLTATGWLMQCCCMRMKVAVRWLWRLLMCSILIVQILLVEIHAEATSEKLAMGYQLDGRVSAVWGTHTHVPTADAQVFERGMGYVTDLGMCGAVRSVLGIRPEQSVETFLGGRPGRYAAPDGPCKMEGVIFSLDSDSGRCVGAERIDIR